MPRALLILCAAAFLSCVAAAAAEETRGIHLIQDDAQVKTATRIYTLRHLKASDIMSFVDAACRRYWINSQVRALDFSAEKKQMLVVTTGEKFLPYVDQIIATLDRPAKRDAYGSTVTNAGYKWQTYYPKYRLTTDLTCYAELMLSGNGNVYAENRTLWLKADQDDIDYALRWIRYFDHPLPQASLTFRYYSVRESTLRDVGIDYLAWKNGPGMNLFEFAFNGGRVAWDRILNTAANLAGNSALGWAYGGIFTAPAFDMSFVRLLQQAGDAKVLGSASIIVSNLQEMATVSLTPTYNGIVKDSDNHATSVQPFNLTDILLHVYSPSICFFADRSETNEMGWIPSSPEFYAKNRGSIVFAYDVTSSDEAEANNYGVQITNSTYNSSTWKTLEFGKEQLLVNAVREYDVEQTTGVPGLCQLPVLKYIFGTTTTIKEKNHIFVTVEANLVHPEATAVKK